MMRFLADENVPLSAISSLRGGGHDVASILEECPGCRDPEVLDIAISESRVLITFDKDFGELASRRALPPACGVVLVRLLTLDRAATTDYLVAALGARSDWAGHFSVIESDRVRMRRLPASS